MAALGREHRQLEALVEMGGKLTRYDQELAETRELLHSDDPDMAAEAKAEWPGAVVAREGMSVTLD